MSLRALQPTYIYGRSKIFTFRFQQIHLFFPKGYKMRMKLLQIIFMETNNEKLKRKEILQNKRKTTKIP